MAIHIYVADSNLDPEHRPVGTLHSEIPQAMTIRDAQLAKLCAPNAVMTANGLAAKEIYPPLDATHVWDVASKSVIEIAPAYVPRWLRAATWVARFTPDEYAAMRNSTDPRVQQLLFGLDNADDGSGRKSIDLNAQMVVDGVDYLVTLGLLTAERVPEIMG